MLISCLAYPGISSSNEALEALIYLPKIIPRSHISDEFIHMGIPCLYLLLNQIKYPVIANTSDHNGDGSIEIFDVNSVTNSTMVDTHKMVPVDEGVDHDRISQLNSFRVDSQQLFQSLYTSWSFNDLESHAPASRDDLLSLLLDYIVEGVSECCNQYQYPNGPSTNHSHCISNSRHIEAGLYGLYAMIDICGEVGMTQTHSDDISGRYISASGSYLESSDSLFGSWVQVMYTVHTSVTNLIQLSTLSQYNETFPVSLDNRIVLVPQYFVVVIKRLMELWTRFMVYFGRTFGADFK